MEAPTNLDTQKNLLREFKLVLRPGALRLISDYPLQRILQLWARQT